VRYNRLFETNSQLKCEQCDRSWGDNGGFLIRRLRIIFFAQIHKRLYFYIQPDFATAASTQSQNFAQLRDVYIDIGLDPKNDLRLRIGQSKVPYGFENLQSSQNRLLLDRNDALNSGLANERDIGTFLYWSPEKTRTLFSSLVSEGLKGSGDFGVVGFGVYNGQTPNRPEQNNSLHVAGRISYPLLVGKQVIEPGIQAYSGKYVVTADQQSPGTKIKADRNYSDQRLAGSFVLYPKPLGLQAEYNVGRGPEFNKITDSIETRRLSGGYITLSYFLKKGGHLLTPFNRYQTYDGGKKHELYARGYNDNEC
jgi:phosphate-selective porin